MAGFQAVEALLTAFELGIFVVPPLSLFIPLTRFSFAFSGEGRLRVVVVAGTDCPFVDNIRILQKDANSTFPVKLPGIEDELLDILPLFWQAIEELENHVLRRDSQYCVCELNVVLQKAC